MEIEGVALIDRSWIIKITNVTSSITNNGVNNSNTYIGSTVTMNANLPTSTSTVTYTITLQNQGNLKAILHSIEKIEDDNSNIIYTMSGVEEGVTTLNPGETNTVTVTIKYKDGVTNLSDTEKSVMLSFNYVENTSTGGNTGGGTPTEQYDYKVGNKVTLVNGTTWYVVKDSNTSDEYVTLISDANHGSYAFDSSGSTMYNPTSTTNIGYTLDNTILPSIKTAIDNNGGNSTGTTARLLTLAEYNTFIGLGKSFGSSETWLMTEDSTTAVNYFNGSLTTKSATETGATRPVIITLKSNIIPKVTITVTSNNTSYGTVSPSIQEVEPGSTVTLTLAPADGYIYDSNTCGGTVSNNTLTISNVTEDKTCVVNFKISAIYLADKILADNDEQADTSIDFSAISSSTNGQGLYYTSTNTENNQTTYYYRGAVDNNYVKFGKTDGCVYKGKEVYYFDESTESLETIITQTQCESTTVCTVEGIYTVGLGDTGCDAYAGENTEEYATYGEDAINHYWKIVRINEDGSIRLIYQGTSVTATGTSAAIGNSSFNSTANNNAYVGYMYGTASSSSYSATHVNTNDSTIKEVLDDWYEVNLKNNYSSYLADAGFCNDRSLYSGTGYTSTGPSYYSAYNRLSTNKKPQFACPNASNDLFTLKGSGKGNKSLDNPIGLITVDEVAYAGGKENSTNKTYYLYTGASYWTMSPSLFNGSTSREWLILGSGGFNSAYVVNTSSVGVRPVINLRSDIEITDDTQNGTSTNYYVIKTN